MSDEMTKEQIAEIRARCEKAKIERWKCSKRKCSWMGTDSEKVEAPVKDYPVKCTELRCPKCDCNSFYRVKATKEEAQAEITASRTDIPLLLRHIEAVEGKCGECFAKLLDVVPQTYGEAIVIYPWIDCENHEWDNRRTEENALWLITSLQSALTEAEKRVGELERRESSAAKPASKYLNRYLVSYCGGLGDDVWDREITVYAEDINEALRIAQARAADESGEVDSISFSESLATRPLNPTLGEKV